jgi:cysteine desulfurase
MICARSSTTAAKPMPVYLDHNATSPMHPQVVDAMLPFLQNPTGNPSSLHSYGRMARSAIESARAEVANLLGCSSDEVIFTSGGTEANNLLLKGYVDKSIQRPIVSSEIEHPSILEPLRQLQAEGQEVVLLKPDHDGLIDQAVGKIPLDMAQLGIDALSFSAHKLRGPQGVGALVVKRKPKHVLISGGHQENKRRGGTENVAGIVGLGKAAQLARLEIEQKQHHLAQLRDVFENRLATIPGSVVFGQRAPRLPNTTYFALPYYHGETLLMELDRAGFALSSGSACQSAVTEPSHVLSAMGVDDNLALNAIRVSFGMDNSLNDVDMLILKLQELVNKLPAVIRQAAV